MSVEVVCGNCQGRLIVETPGIVVACPHCGTHLSIPPETTPQVAEDAAMTQPAAPQQPTAAPPTEETATTVATEIPEIPTAETPVETGEAAQLPPSNIAEQPSEVEQPVDFTAGVHDTSAAEQLQTAEISPEEFSADPQSVSEEVSTEPRAEMGDAQTAENVVAENSDVNPTQDWSAPTAEADSNVPEEGAPFPSMGDEETIISVPTESPLTEEFANIGDSVADADEPATAWIPPGEGESPAFSAAPDAASPDSDFDPTVDLSAPLDGEIPEFEAQPAIEQTEAWAGESIPETEEQVTATAPGFGADDNQQAAWASSPEAASMATEAQIDRPMNQQAVAVPTAATVQTSKRSRGFLPLLVLILISYSSALTLAFVFLMIKMSNPDPHDLENLPDLKPPMRKNKIALKLVPEGAEMAPGHSLKLGSEQRFGSLKVTPIKVTKGPLTFEYFDRDPTKKKSSTKPVLKLWLRFENVSSDQVFAPLDRKLMLTRVASMKGVDHDRANNFICRRSQKKKNGKRVLVYEIPEDSPWDFRGQQPGKELSPGEVFETYIPTSESGLDKLDGNLIWRVQFRKGYNPESFRGVTTLIEVVFHSDEIVKDTPTEKS